MSYDKNIEKDCLEKYLAITEKCLAKKTYKYDNILEAIYLLRHVYLSIPVEPYDIGIDPSKLKVGDHYTMPEQKPHKIILSKRSDGAVFYQLFTSGEAEKSFKQVGPAYYDSMYGDDVFNGLMKMPPTIEGIVIDPYTRPFMIPRDILIGSAGIQRNTVAGGTEIKLQEIKGKSIDGIIKAAISKLKDDSGIEEAYIAEMTRNGETSILIYIDGSISDPNIFMLQLNSIIQQEKPPLPVDYMFDQEEIKEFLIQDGIGPFYKK